MQTLVCGALVACATQEDDDLDYGEATSAATVGSFVESGCSTSVVRGLSIQIAEEVECASPSSLVDFKASTKVRFSSNAVLPYLHSRARTDLLAVSGTLRVNSAYRTVAQQYLLYRWWQQGRCGISAAATPGRSNHESGRAIDLANWSERRASMVAHHWAHDVPGDAVHFDNTRSPDNRGLDVRAFQRLWNRNHPTDKIAVDGDYGPQTAARLKRAPATGFAKGPTCRTAVRGVQILAIDGPDRVAPGEPVHYAFTLSNTEETAWPATVRVVVDGGVPSELAAPSWASPSEPGTLAAAIDAGGNGVFDLDVAAPVEAGDHAAVFALLDGERQIGTFELAFTVTNEGAGTSGESDDADDIEDVDADEDGVVTGTGGCNTSGGAGGGLLLVVAFAAASRRARGTRRSGR